MSEIAPSIEPNYPRKVPREVANAPVNDIFRKAITDSIAQTKAEKHSSRDEYVDEVVENFYAILGSGAVMARIEEVAKDLPDQYLAGTPRDKTAFKYVSRADFRSFAHTAVLSPVLAFETKDSATPCYVGTDKLGHIAQQGYDYWTIYKIIEPEMPGLGELFACAWGIWTEGKEISEAEIREYLTTKGLSSSVEETKRIKKEIVHFLTKSDEIKFMNPIPLKIRGNRFLRNLAHLIGTHEKGILGTVSSGVFSYADLEANEAGFRFYLDLEKDPESMAEHFDIKDYVTCRCDEEVLKPEFSPIIKERIEEAISGRRGSYFTFGIGAQYDVLRNLFNLSVPALYVSFEDIELRLRLGMGIPFTSSLSEFESEIRATSSFDLLFRLKGLHFAYLSASAGFTPEYEFCPTLEAGYELMLLGKTSFQIGYIFDPMNLVSSFGLGFLILWR